MSEVFRSINLHHGEVIDSDPVASILDNGMQPYTMQIDVQHCKVLMNDFLELLKKKEMQ